MGILDDDIFAAYEDEMDRKAAENEPHKYLPSFPGRSNPAPYSLQKLAKEHTQEALDVVLEIMRDSEAEPGTRLEAAKQMLDRGWGKAALKVQTESIQYTLKDIEEKLLEHRQEVDVKVLEARRVESEQLLKYITDDAEVVGDSASSS